MHACFTCAHIPFLALLVLRVVNVDRADTGQWVNFSTADIGNGVGDPISFLVLPENIGNLSSCPTAIVSGAVAGLHLVLPSYSNFSARTASGSEDRILSGLWLVALSPFLDTCYSQLRVFFHTPEHGIAVIYTPHIIFTGRHINLHMYVCIN